MRLRWLGTAGFDITSSQDRILIDPYLSRNLKAFPFQPLKPRQFESVDAIFLTHGHFDHALDVPEIARLSGAKVYASRETCKRLQGSGVEPSQLEPLSDNACFEVGAFKVKAIPSEHVDFDLTLVVKTLLRSLPHLPSVLKLGSHYPVGEVFAFLIEVEGKRLLHMGSAYMSRELLDEGAIDLFLVPVQGRSDITRLAAQIVAELRPRYVIPHHHDDFYPPLSQTIDLQPFIAELEILAPRVRVIVPSINNWVEF